ncbi:MAG: 4Fe-4S dicluster domain-containing protein [Bacillota bacterium]
MTSAQKTCSIEIDKKLCKKCGLCVEFCPKQVLTSEKDGSPFVSHPEKCVNCKLCSLRCPDFAISRRQENETDICAG